LKTTRATENYLETILILMKKNGSVRSIDIANELGYSRPTVSVAMKDFRAKGYITVDDGGLITLTESGREIAETIYERHVVLSQILISLGVSEEIAMADACRLEHEISDESFRCMKEHYEKQIKEKNGSF
jgi:DtxR family Mn-dependent transcriptional regulator